MAGFARCASANFRTMKTPSLLLAFIASLSGLVHAEPAASSPYNVIPEPARVEPGQGTTRNLRFNVKEARLDPSLGAEGYSLDITPKGIHLQYADKRGLENAKVTILQLEDQLGASPGGIPCGKVTDKPAYAWRGMMCDVARSFMPLKDLKKFVDAMHFYKFNVLHLHLTDDQGWRLPVPGYDKLKTVAATRGPGDGGGPGWMPASSGMYTKQELKEIVAYCAERGIQVVPEIDVPGHNQALCNAYPEMFCQNPSADRLEEFQKTNVYTGKDNAKKRELLTPPQDIKIRREGGVSFHLLCPQSKEMWKFYEAVVKELADIFPGKIVHLGGDEAPAERWELCEACTEARKAKGLANTNAQMREFFKEMTTLLARHGREAQFWFELEDDFYQKGQTVYTWRLGKTPATVNATKKAGLQLILTPGEHCYLDYPQLPGQSNRGWMPGITLEQSYQLDPTQGKPAEEVDHIIGVHCTMWAEQLPTLEHTLYRAYPRAMAIAEKGWSPKSAWNWERFQQKQEAHKKPFEKRFGYTLERTKDNEPAVKP